MPRWMRATEYAISLSNPLPKKINNNKSFPLIVCCRFGIANFQSTALIINVYTYILFLYIYFFPIHFIYCVLICEWSFRFDSIWFDLEFIVELRGCNICFVLLFNAFQFCSILYTMLAHSKPSYRRLNRFKNVKMLRYVNCRWVRYAGACAHLHFVWTNKYRLLAVKESVVRFASMFLFIHHVYNVCCVLCIVE